ncbi:MAG: metallophosphoesterase [Bacteroidetes bacterium]|nr:metallophosphoesterase [Bacteroidota bacterium]
MKKHLVSAIFVVLSLSMVVVLRAFLPKYSGMFLYFFFFLVFYGYLWFSVSRGLHKHSRVLRSLAAILYWFPVALIVSLMGYGFMVSFLEWNIPFRTYLQSIILILFLAEFLPMVTLILADTGRLVDFTFQRLVRGRTISFNSLHRFKPILVTGWIMGALVFLIMAAGMLFWQFDFTVRRQGITLNELPAAFNGLKIVQISDVHLGSWGSKQRLQEAMDQINELKPDVIFFTGDMFNYCTADGRGFENILKTLQAPFGIYAILGNHDYGDYITWPTPGVKKKNMSDLVSFYNNLGWKLLRNSHDILRRGNDSIAVIGVENWGSTRRFQRRGDMAVAQEGTENMAIQLLLSHDPSHWDKIVSKDYPKIDVTFAGHTHGGQIGIDCCNIHWSPVKWLYAHWCGLYQSPGAYPPQYLYVNQGLGNIGYSGRIGILPEITLFTLMKGTSGNQDTGK